MLRRSATGGFGTEKLSTCHATQPDPGVAICATQETSRPEDFSNLSRTQQQPNLVPAAGPAPDDGKSHTALAIRKLREPRDKHKLRHEARFRPFAGLCIMGQQDAFRHEAAAESMWQVPVSSS
jgi:hypothetical protein